jgi:hypothetical protein
MFQYSRDGQYSVWKYVNGTATAVKYWTASTKINQGSAWNTLGVWLSGNSLWFNINGTWVWNGTDSSLAMGNVGLGFYDSGSSSDSLYVDWATLSILGPYETASADMQISEEQQMLNEIADQYAVGGPDESPGYVWIQKSGSGTGTISLNGYTCGAECSVLAFPYIDGAQFQPEAVADPGSRFVGWQTADGVVEEMSVLYAAPGDTVLAVFEKDE